MLFIPTPKGCAGDRAGDVNEGVKRRHSGEKNEEKIPEDGDHNGPEVGKEDRLDGSRVDG